MTINSFCDSHRSNLGDRRRGKRSNSLKFVSHNPISIELEQYPEKGSLAGGIRLVRFASGLAWNKISQTQFSGQDAAYLSGLAISSRRRHRRTQVLPFRRKGRFAPARVVGQDPPANVALPLRMLVIHVVAGLAEVVAARVASREHILGAAQGALANVPLGCRGWFLGREFDDLVVGVTTVPRERRRWDFRGRRGPT